jgi:DNA-binding transcriptional LysR family regulator
LKPRVAKSETCAAELVDLRAFCFVTDLGSVTAAAKAMGETKGSVSRRLTRLERAVGVSLLRRSPRSVQPTDDGLAYRLGVGRALELLDDANAAVQHARVTPRGILRVTAPSDLGVSVVAKLVAGFLERYPEISVEMLLTDAVLDFDAHQVDVALRASAGLQDSSLIAHKLQDLQGGLYASPGYLKKHRPLRKPEDLAAHRLLLMRSARGQATVALWKQGERERTEIKVRAALSASDFSFVREAVLAGAGIGLLPYVIIDRDRDATKLVRVLDEYRFEGASLYLVHSGTRILPPRVRVFRDYILEAFSARGRKRGDKGA